MAGKPALIGADTSTEADGTDEQEKTDNATETEETDEVIKPNEGDETDETDEIEAETPKMTRDSMVTVRLSEPPSLSLDTTPATLSTTAVTPSPPAGAGISMTASNDNIENEKHTKSGHSSRTKSTISRDSSLTLSSIDASRSLQDELSLLDEDGNETDSSEENEEVNWEELEKTEDEQMKDEETDNVCSSKTCLWKKFSTLLTVT
jgi:hypothetical protein